MTFSAMAAALLALVLLPLIILLWATESKAQRINRMRANGYTWKRIAERYSVSPSTVKRWSMA